VEASLRDEGHRFTIFHPFLELGLYRGQVARYLERFPRENILMLDYAAYRDRTTKAMAQIFRFLGVAPSFRTRAYGSGSRTFPRRCARCERRTARSPRSITASPASRSPRQKP
jgi:sulfotransferase family protein